MPAIAIMDELEQMNVPVPARIAVTGFDDIEDARLSQPALTTVRQPLPRQGREAVRLLCLAIATASQPQSVSTPTELVLRASCGCSTKRTGASVAPPAAQRKFLVSIMGRRPHIAAKLGRVARGALLGATSGWEEQLIGSIVEDVQSARPATFPATFGKLADRWMSVGADLSVVEAVVTSLRREIRSGFAAASSPSTMSPTSRREGACLLRTIRLDPTGDARARAFLRPACCRPT